MTFSLFVVIALVVLVIMNSVIITIILRIHDDANVTNHIRKSEHDSVNRLFEGLKGTLAKSFERIEQKQENLSTALNEFCAVESRFSREQIDICQQEKIKRDSLVDVINEHVKSCNSSFESVKQEILGKLDELNRTKDTASQGPSVQMPNIEQMMGWVKQAEAIKDQFGPVADILNKVLKTNGK